ncbi:MAG: outer membrane protein transport protein [Deltaproteobacteria bacterium]|nr:outer membrane protein transport protein [Deltaproteobacteria bacterium]
MRRFVAVLLLSPSVAYGSVADVFDVGKAMGTAGAAAATSDDGAAAFYNPGGLGFADRTELSVGAEAVRSELRLAGDRVPLPRPWGVLVLGTAPLPLAGVLERKIAVGALLYVGPESHLVVAAPASTAPTLPYYHNRSERLLALPVLALRPVDAVAVGVSANYFAGVRGAVEGDQVSATEIRAAVQEEFYSQASYNAGVQVRLGAWRAGLSYRGQFSVPVATSVRLSINGKPMTVDLRAAALFTPETFVLAAAYDLGRLRLAADLSWRRWSRYRPPFPEIDATIPPLLPQGGDTVSIAATRATVRTRDVPRLALGAELALYDSLTGRAGLAYEPTPFRAGGGLANLVDGDKQVGGLGVSYHGLERDGFRFGVDLALQAQWMTFRRLAKDPAELQDELPSVPGRQTTNRGYEAIAGGGLVLAATLSLVVSWPPADAAAGVSP